MGVRRAEEKARSPRKTPLPVTAPILSPRKKHPKYFHVFSNFEQYRQMIQVLVNCCAQMSQKAVQVRIPQRTHDTYLLGQRLAGHRSHPRSQRLYRLYSTRDSGILHESVLKCGRTRIVCVQAAWKATCIRSIFSLPRYFPQRCTSTFLHQSGNTAHEAHAGDLSL